MCKKNTFLAYVLGFCKMLKYAKEIKREQFVISTKKKERFLTLKSVITSPEIELGMPDKLSDVLTITPNQEFRSYCLPLLYGSSSLQHANSPIPIPIEPLHFDVRAYYAFSLSFFFRIQFSENSKVGLECDLSAV